MTPPRSRRCWRGPRSCERIGYAVPGGLEALTPPVSPTVAIGRRRHHRHALLGAHRPALRRRTGDDGTSVVDRHPRGVTCPSPRRRSRWASPSPRPTGVARPRPRRGAPDAERTGPDPRRRCSAPADAGWPGCGCGAPTRSPSNVGGRLGLTDLELDGAPLRSGERTTGCRSRRRPRTAPRRCPARATTSSSTSTTPASRVLSRWADVPDPMPVVLAGRPPADASGDDFTLVGLGGRPVASRAVEHVDALPAVTDHGALADLDAQLRVGGEVPPGLAPAGLARHRGPHGGRGRSRRHSSRPGCRSPRRRR